MSEVNINWSIVFEVIRWRFIEELQRRCPVHDSDLRNSISAIIKDDQFFVAMLPYGKYVDEGSNPHWTSVDNLKKWARDKLGDENAAYAVQRKIAKFGCFFGNSHRYKILTKRGYKALKDVNVGDLVLTHKNTWKKVIDKPVYDIKYKILRYKIELESGKKVNVTEEHPFYCLRNNRKQWVKAKDLKETDKIFEVL